jgi:hypothetical protein
MKDDSWGRGRGEENGDYGGGGKGEEAGTESIPQAPDIVSGEAGEEESGLDFGDGLDLKVFVSFCAISHDSYIKGLLLLR